VRGEVNAKLSHRSNGEGMHPRFFRARAGNIESVAGNVTEKPFGHLASGGVVGAEKKNSLLPVSVFHAVLRS